MPIYEYKCSRCKHEWDSFRAVDKPLMECPRCLAWNRPRPSVSAKMAGNWEVESDG